MTKIKLIKDIPGYKAGTILTNPSYCLNEQGTGTIWEGAAFIDNGWAVSLPDTVDVEKIRENIKLHGHSTSSNSRTSIAHFDDEVTLPELRFFIAYRIVSEVIRLLNDGWEADWGDDKQIKTEIYFYHYGSTLQTARVYSSQASILPYCKSEEVAKEVIRLCETELQVLFNIK